MRFWSIAALAGELASGRVTDRKAMHYFLASTLLILAQTHYALWWGPRSGWLFHFELLALATIACIGCVQCGSAGNGRDFALRIVCLSVPCGVRVFALSLVLGLALHFNAATLFDHVTFRDPGRAFDLVSYAGFFGFSVYFWYLLHQGMAAISRLQQPEGASPGPER